MSEQENVSKEVLAAAKALSDIEADQLGVSHEYHWASYRLDCISKAKKIVDAIKNAND